MFEEEEHFVITSSTHLDTLRGELIQLSGLEEYCDLEVYCSDGGMRMNRFLMGLLFPVVTDHGAVYLPDYTQEELQKSVNQSMAGIKIKEKGSPVYLSVRSPSKLLASTSTRTVPSRSFHYELPIRCESPPTSVDPRQLDLLLDDSTGGTHSIFNGYQDMLFDGLDQSQDLELDSVTPNVGLDQSEDLGLDSVTPNHSRPRPHPHTGSGPRKIGPKHGNVHRRLSHPVSVLSRHPTAGDREEYSPNQKFILYSKTKKEDTASIYLTDEFLRKKYKEIIKLCDVQMKKLVLNQKMREDIELVKEERGRRKMAIKMKMMKQRNDQIRKMMDNQRKDIKNRPKKKTRCQRCVNCIVMDCMICFACRDMRKYGGPQKLKQACRNRPKCLFLERDQVPDGW